MAHVTLKQLRYLVALAKERHFGRAAEACAVTQPALSMQIKELEASLGAALVDRAPGGLGLTAAGAEAARRAAAVLLDVQDLADAVRAAEQDLAGRLRLGVIPTVAPYLLPQLLTRLRAEHPELDLRVMESRTRTLVAELLAGGIDAAIVAKPAALAPPGQADALVERPLLEDPFVLAAPPGGALDGTAAVLSDAAALGGARLLLLEEGHCFRDQALSVPALREACALDDFGASSLATLAQMTAAGMGVTLLPSIGAGLEARRAGVRLIALPDPAPKRARVLLWRAASPRAAAFETIAAHAAAAGAAALAADQTPAS